jgi:hypothetical protein
MSNPGEISIPYGSGAATLRCSLRAAKEINAHFGNFMEAGRCLQVFDLAAYTAIVSAGLAEPRDKVESGVYEAGMRALVQPLSDFVTMLANGGRPMPKDGEGPKTGEA